jgi:hypothetical protein
MVSKGRSRDTAWYSILDDEWPEVREIIKAWLDDDNFDAAGHARRSLSELMQKRGPSLRGRTVMAPLRGGSRHPGSRHGHLMQ